MIPNFRVWDINRKCYHKDMDLYDLYIQNKKLYERTCYTDDFDRMENVTEQYIVEMGSGVPDVNGDEIFEGSIVNYGDERGEISFTEGSFCIYFEGWFNNINEFYSRELEIVGHIHDAIQTA